MIPAWATLFAVAVGPLLSGVAAIYGEFNRRRIRKLADAVDGQTHALVATTHALGISEGTTQAQADAFTRGDTRGVP